MEIKLEDPLSVTLILLRLMPGSQIQCMSKYFSRLLNIHLSWRVDAAHTQSAAAFCDGINIRLDKSTAGEKTIYKPIPLQKIQHTRLSV